MAIKTTSFKSCKTFPMRSITVCLSIYFLLIMLLVASSSFGLVRAAESTEKAESVEADATDSTTEAPNENEIHHVDGMQWRIQQKPSDCNEVSAVGDKLEVHYTGFLENGMVFDSSVKNERPPIGLTLGAKQVIEGWEKGLVGMCVGERRRLIIPPHLGYGDAGYPPSIPPRAKLLFEVTLVSLQKANRSQWVDNITSSINMIKLVGPPLLAIYLIYFLWRRYKSEMAEQKNEKRRSKKRK